MRPHETHNGGTVVVVVGTEAADQVGLRTIGHLVEHRHIEIALTTRQRRAMELTRRAPTRADRRLEKTQFWRHWRSIPEETVACCVCGAVDTAPFIHEAMAPGDVIRCTGCGTVFVSPVRVRGLNLSEKQDEAERLTNTVLRQLIPARRGDALSSVDRSPGSAWETRSST